MDHTLHFPESHPHFLLTATNPIARKWYEFLEVARDGAEASMSCKVARWRAATWKVCTRCFGETVGLTMCAVGVTNGRAHLKDRRTQTTLLVAHQMTRKISLFL